MYHPPRSYTARGGASHNNNNNQNFRGNGRQQPRNNEQGNGQRQGRNEQGNGFQQSRNNEQGYGRQQYRNNEQGNNRWQNRNNQQGYGQPQYRNNQLGNGRWQHRNNEEGNDRAQPRNNQQNGNLHGILHVHELEQIQNDIRNHQLLIGSSDLLDRLNVPAVFHRMDRMFQEVGKQEEFVGLILETAQANLRQEQLREMGHLFLRRILDTKLIANLMNEHISKIRSDPQKRVPPASKIAEHFCGLLTLGWRSRPTIMTEKFLTITDSAIAALNSPLIQSASFPTEMTKQWLGEIQQIMQNQFAANEVQNIEAINTGQRTNGERNNNSGPPPEDFRLVQVAPREEFLLCSNSEIYLRKAIIVGQYQDDEHYLDVQFRLMREDLYRPLRDGIFQFRRNQNQARVAGHRPEKTDLFIYTDVRLNGMELNKEAGDMLAYFQLNRNDRKKRLHKKLMYGSLVCLTTDQFQHHFLFGTITDRDNLTNGGKIGINLFTEEDGKKPAIQFNTDYSMVESPAFYEAYKHVLTALQAFPKGNSIPFSKYLVHLNPEISIPRYLTMANGQIGRNVEGRRAEERDLDFECLLTENAKQNRAAEMRTTKCKATQIREHFTANDFGMDQSQFDALVHAIRSDLAVIQGPPGTGKTFLGLKLVQFLFANEQFWAPSTNFFRVRRILYDDDYDENDEEDNDMAIRRPMLVVCFTNHALDQFLEGMIPFLKGNGIVRVGGQCKNEELKGFTLGKLRSKYRPNINEYIPDARNRNEYYDCQRRCNEILDSREHWKKATRIPGWILENKLIKNVAEELLQRNFESLLENRSQFCVWLGQFKRESQMEMDVGFVRMLVNQKEMQENDAKALAFYAHTDGNFDIRKIYNGKNLTREFRNEILQTKSHPYFIEQTAHWPQLRILNEFGDAFAQCENLAIQWLQSVKGNSAQILAHLNQNMGWRIGGAQGRQNNNQQQPNETERGILIENVEDENQKENENEENEVYDDRDADERRIYDEESDYENEEDVETHKESWKSQQINLKLWMEKNKRLRDFFIHRTKAMSEDEALDWLERDDPWAMPLHERWRLYRFWANLWERKENAKQEENVNEYHHVNQRYQYYRGQADLAILKRAKVIGMTTTGAARLQYALRSLKPRIVVVEEAAEVFEPHIVTSLTECCEHLILIGDHQQLRPNPADYRLGKEYHLDISLFERLVNNGFHFQTLRKQHRMRPEISQPLMPHFYKDLEDDESVFGRENIQGMQKNIFFINHHNSECSQRNLGDGKSKANPFEAEFAVRIAKYLTQQEYMPEQITILCTYVEQMFDVRNRMKNAFPKLPSKNPNDPQPKQIRVDVVDNYQGEECDIIILSLVRSNHPENKIGFLNIPNRICVALSRAKMGFYVLGNFDYLAKNCHGAQPDLWKNIRQSMLDQNALGPALPIMCKLHGEKQEISSAEQFMEKSPEGGCCRPCAGRLECGHTCDKMCHAYYADHSMGKCLKKCAKFCENELHQNCQLLCHQQCAPCTEITVKALKCGHKTRDECWKPVDKIFCQEKCPLTLPCLHQCAGQCSAKCPPCQQLISKQLPCGHYKVMECSEQTTIIKCDILVEKKWPYCGHIVKVECQIDPEKVPCPKPCVKTMIDQEDNNKDQCHHPCKGTCGQCRNGRLHIECSEECKRILICDHECGSKCSGGCPPCHRPCETRCGHSQCSLATVEGEKQRAVRKWDDIRRNDEERKKGKNVGRLCGEPCPPCQEPCLNECPHRKCSKRCSEPCDVLPCDEPCKKRLKCSPEDPNLPEHFCAGICSEKCIEICQFCEPKKFHEKIVESFIGFGYEDEPDARFVQLQDCHHYFEVKGLDIYVKGKVEEKNGKDNQQILKILCPQCKTPIRRSKRYISLLNQRAKDIEQIKSKIIGTKSSTKLQKEWELKKIKIVAWLKEWISTFPLLSINLKSYDQIRQQIECISTRFEYFRKINVTTKWMESTLKNIENILRMIKSSMEKVVVDCPTNIYQWTKTLDEFNIDPYDVQAFLLNDLAELLERISVCPGGLHAISDATFMGIGSELARNEFMLNLFKFMKKVTSPSSSASSQPSSSFLRNFRHGTVPHTSQLERHVLEILDQLHADKPFTEIRAKMNEHLKMLAEKHGIPGLGISREEFIQIHRAFEGNIGQWYKCSKGHYYHIGECGQAMQRGQCPECKEVIGGESHRLVGTSQQAAALSNVLAEVDPRIQQEHDPFVARF